MSNSDILEFEGLRSQRIAIREALTDLSDRGESDQRIVDLLAKYLGQGQLRGFRKGAPAISRPTIQRIRTATDPVLENMRPATLRMIFNFLNVCEELPTALFEARIQVKSAHEMAPMLEAIQLHVGAKDGPLTNAKLKSLEGTFHLYRKAWTSLAHDTYVRCILTFNWIGDALFYTELQQFTDTVAKLPVDETDTGIVIPFGMNVVLLGKGQNKDLLKFFSLHDFTPYPDGHQQVHNLSGNFIAVYSKGPHPGFKAFAQRVDPSEASTEFYNADELDPEILRRLNG